MPHSTPEKRRAYYKRRRKHFNKKSLEYYHAHKDKIKKQRKEWRNNPKNKKKLAKQKRKYYRKNKIKIAAWHKIYNKAHKQQVRERSSAPSIRFSGLKTRAKRRGLACTILFEDYKKLILQPCFYCGKKLQRFGIGLDRIDSLKGYTKKNVAPCCPICNTIKWDLTMREFISHIKLIYKRFKNYK